MIATLGNATIGATAATVLELDWRYALAGFILGLFGAIVPPRVVRYLPI